MKKNIKKYFSLLSIFLILIYSSASNDYFKNEYAILHLFFIILTIGVFFIPTQIVTKNLLNASFIWIIYNAIFILFHGVLSWNALFYFIVIILSSNIIIVLNGRDLMKNIDSVVFFLSVISLSFYIIQSINFSFAFNFIRSVQNLIGIPTHIGHPEVTYSNILFYTICDYGSGIPGLRRNYGFMWEPGGFATILLMGFFIHLSLNNYNLRDKKSIIYIITMLTTFSTTGLLGLSVIFLFSASSNFKINLKSISLIFIAIIAIFFIATSQWVSGKIEKTYSQDMNLTEIDQGNSVGSLGRFGGMYINIREFMERPFLGHHFDKRDRIVNENTASVNGLGTILARYGLFGFTFLIIYYLKSAKKLFGRRKNADLVFFILLLICGFAFDLMRTPFFIIFFAYGFLGKHIVSTSDILNSKQINLINNK